MLVKHVGKVTWLSNTDDIWASLNVSLDDGLTNEDFCIFHQRIGLIS